MLHANLVQDQGGQENKQCRNDKAGERMKIDGVKKGREVIDVQGLRGVDVGNKQAGCPDDNRKNKQEKDGLVKGI